MKKTLSLLLTIITIILLPSLSRAEEQKAKDRVKFYDFDEMLIDGEIKKPSGLLTDVRGRVKFNHLLKNIKRSFLKELEDTAKEKALK